MIKQKKFANLTYKIGVMLNEASLFRSSYANTIPFLEKISNGLLSNNEVVEEKVHFLPITAENIDELFIDNAPDNLFTFDAIIVSTNSTNEDAFLKKIREHKDEFAKFVQQKKGLFILSQKKLSASENNTIDFLPEILKYKLVERTDSDSSKSGKIKLDSPDYLSRNWDDNKNERSIDSICENNDFQTHRYRSYIVPLHAEQYVSLLTDEKNEKDKEVKLLLRSKRYRVVISSMALDHEKQAEVIKSVLVYILKGMPALAFVGKMNDNGFKSLYYNALIDKINCNLYDSFDKIPENDLSVFNVFIVNHSISRNQVETYWQKLNSGSCKVYHIQKYATSQVLLEYSNITEADMVVDNASAWILSVADESTAEFETQSTWRNNFWISFDVLRYLHNYSTIRTSSKEKIYKNYISTILERAKGHFKENYTYDGVFNCSCALLTMLLFDEVDDSFIKAMPPENVMANLKNQYEQVSAARKHFSDCISYKLMLGDIADTPMLKNNFDRLLPEFKLDIDVNYEVDRIFGYTKADLVERSEIELSNFIGILHLAIKHGKNSSVTKEDLENKIILILNLMIERQENGLWKRISQTAKILTDLQTYIINSSALFENSDITVLAGQIVDSGINFLVSSCRESRQWNNDVLSTANAANALLLYTKSNKYTIRDFKSKFDIDFSQIEVHDEIVDNIEILSKSYRTISGLNRQINELTREKKSLEDEKTQIEKNQGELKNKYRLRLLLAIYIACFAIFMFLFERFEVFNDLKELLSIVFSIMLGGIVTAAVELFARLDIKIKNNKKNKEAKYKDHPNNGPKKKKRQKKNDD